MARFFRLARSIGQQSLLSHGSHNTKYNIKLQLQQNNIQKGCFILSYPNQGQPGPPFPLYITIAQKGDDILCYKMTLFLFFIIFLNVDQKIKYMSSQSVYNEILVRIKRVYQNYEENVNQMAQQKRQKTGNKADKNQEQFLKSLATLEKNISDLLGQMKKSEKGTSNEYREHMAAVQDCTDDIRSILKKKSLNFKVNLPIKQIIEDTESSLIMVRKDLVGVKDTKTLCCGTDGAKKFKTPMNYFKIVAGKWKMIACFEPKEGIETFVNPKFSQNDYQFISQILKKKWPESKVVEVQREVIKQVIKEVKVGNSIVKPNKLHDANQLLYGINKEENIVQGLNIYHQEADDNNNPQASAFLGRIYEDGLYLPQDIKKSISYYQRAISGRQPYAQYRYALGLINGKFSKNGQSKEDIQKGFNIINQIANDNQNPFPQALAQLGQIYEYGFFKCDTKELYPVKKDINKAQTCYSKARSMKLARASNNLGVSLLNNKLSDKKVQKSEMDNNEQDKKILTYLNEAKDQGFCQAYFNLGVIYSKGLINQKNSQQALKMFYQGSIKGDYKCKIQFAYELMNQTSIMKEEYEDHYHLAIHWLQSVTRKLSISEENSHIESTDILKSEKGQALFYLGIFHQHGFGVEKSPKKAIGYFIESSQCDYAAAKNKIGDCYFSGYGIKKDRQLAVGCYLQAAELNNSDAMVNLGTIYLNGVPGIIQKSYKKAYTYFLNANQLQNSDAMIHLSFMYKNGLGVQPNEQIARDLLQQAAQHKNATALYMLKENGLQFNQGIFFQHLENEFFTAPKKINIKEIIPAINSIYKNR